MAPCPSVVRSTVRSWQTTGTPSRESHRSNSISCAPMAMAAAKAGRVFSGQARLSPRWAQSCGKGVAFGSIGSSACDGDSFASIVGDSPRRANQRAASI